MQKLRTIQELALILQRVGEQQNEIWERLLVAIKRIYALSTGSKELRYGVRADAVAQLKDSSIYMLSIGVTSILPQARSYVYSPRDSTLVHSWSWEHWAGFKDPNFVAKFYPSLRGLDVERRSFDKGVCYEKLTLQEKIAWAAGGWKKAVGYREDIADSVRESRCHMERRHSTMKRLSLVRKRFSLAMDSALSRAMEQDRSWHEKLVSVPPVLHVEGVGAFVRSENNTWVRGGYPDMIKVTAEVAEAPRGTVWSECVGWK
jgi:hypothetical protein